MKGFSATPRLTSANRLVAALPQIEQARLQAYLRPVSFSSGETIYHEGDPLDYVYFPETCVVSRLRVLEDGSTVEVGMIGYEGLVGFSAVMGASEANCWMLADIAGSALRLSVNAMREVFRRDPAAQRILMSYHLMLFAHISQRTACSSRHTVLEQFAVWLLMAHDRARRSDLQVTQEAVARRIGARRAGISNAAQVLQQSGAIEQTRGHIIIRDRSALEDYACECYGVVTKESAKFLEQVGQKSPPSLARYS